MCEDYEIVEWPEDWPVDAIEEIVNLEEKNTELKEAVINLMNIHKFSKKEASNIYCEVRKLITRISME